MLSESGASERPASIALYSSTICRKIGSAIISPPSAICCSVCDGDPEAEVLRAEEVGVDQRGLALALALDEPPRERAERDEADGEQRDDGAAALLPDEDAEHDAAHAERGEDRADDVDASVAGVRARRGRSRLPTSTIAMITTSPKNATRHER